MTLREHIARALWADDFPAAWEEGSEIEHDAYYRMAEIALRSINTFIQEPRQEEEEEDE